ncbi:MAG: MFS transporter [Spirochaetales bacterium]|nr:MFS transporter [Spirochaetales bacterium]
MLAIAVDKRRREGEDRVEATRERTGATTGVMLSYGAGKFLAEFLTGGFAALAFKFYETELGLGAGLVAFAVVLYSAWNAVNDPLIGFLTARPTRLSRRWGRRFPWIVAGSLASGPLFLLVFAPPAGLSRAALFAWFLVAICLYDALYSTWELNYQSVFPDRFRTAGERSRAAGIGTAVGTLGIAAGAIVPTFLIRYGDAASYALNGLVFAAASTVLALLLAPGVRETPAMVARFLGQEAARAKAPSFVRQLAGALRCRDFAAFMLLYFFYQSATLSMTASIHYIGDYVVGRNTTMIFAGMLAGALAAVPVWLALGRLVRSRQTLLAAAAAALALLCLPLWFARSYDQFVAAMFAWGLAFGGFWLMMTPALADVIDGVVARTGARDDGVYLGFRAFFGRLAYAVQALVFWAVHRATGFAADPRSAAATAGIRAHTALIPAALLAVGVALFLILNTLDADKAAANRAELERRGL